MQKINCVSHSTPAYIYYFLPHYIDTCLIKLYALWKYSFFYSRIIKAVKMTMVYFFDVVSWPNWEFFRDIRTSVRMMIRYFGQSATIELMHAFMVGGWWATVDFYSQYNILWCETRAQGEPIRSKKNFVQNKNLHKLFPSQTDACWCVGGNIFTYTVLLQTNSK